MNEIVGTLGIAIVLIIITMFAVFFILSLLMPVFVYLINNRMKELLQEQRQANRLIASELQKLNTRIDEIHKHS